MFYPIVLTICFAATQIDDPPIPAPSKYTIDKEGYRISIDKDGNQVRSYFTDFEIRLREHYQRQGQRKLREYRRNPDRELFAVTLAKARAAAMAKARATRQTYTPSYAPTYYYPARSLYSPAYQYRYQYQSCPPAYQYQYRYYVPTVQPYWQFYGAW
jgi:hypothetical protein